MSRMQAARADAATALAAAEALHAALRTQQPLVDALADCVVVVDDDDAHDASESRATSHDYRLFGSFTYIRAQRFHTFSRSQVFRQICFKCFNVTFALYNTD